MEFSENSLKSCALFEILSETKKGAANIFVVSGCACSKSVSKGVCIYGIAKNVLTFYPIESNNYPVNFHNYPQKKHFRCNFLQVASKVLVKHVSSQHFRCSVQSIRIPARFVTFSSQREENHGVEPVEPGSSRCPLGLCI